jgi:hypothetical protein
MHIVIVFVVSFWYRLGDTSQSGQIYFVLHTKAHKDDIVCPYKKSLKIPKG